MFAALKPWAKNLKEQDLMKFDWENKPVANVTEVDIEEMEKRLQERDEKEYDAPEPLNLKNLLQVKKPAN